MKGRRRRGRRGDCGRGGERATRDMRWREGDREEEERAVAEGNERSVEEERGGEGEKTKRGGGAERSDMSAAS